MCLTYISISATISCLNIRTRVSYMYCSNIFLTMTTIQAVKKSKVPIRNTLLVQWIKVGNLVYQYNFVMGENSEPGTVISVCVNWWNFFFFKFVRNQLQKLSYKIKKSECFCVPPESPVAYEAKVQILQNHTDKIEDSAFTARLL